MIDKSTFRKLTLSRLGLQDEAEEEDFEPGPGNSNLICWSGDGITLIRGRQTGRAFVQIEAEPVMANDPEEETRMVALVLSALGLPLRPQSSFGDVIAVMEPICPWITWGRIERKRSMWNRSLLALRDSLHVEMRFRLDRLDTVCVVDLEQMILNDDLPHTAKALQTAAREKMLADFQADPLPFALKFSARGRPEKVEWNRGFDLPAPAPVPASAPVPDKEELDLVPQDGIFGKFERMLERAALGKMGPKADRMVQKVIRTLRGGSPAVVVETASRAEHERMRETYPSLFDTIQKAPVARVTGHVASWSGSLRPADLQPDENRAVRMAVCFHSLETAGRTGMGKWLEEFWTDYGAETVEHLREAGSPHLAEALALAGEKWSAGKGGPVAELPELFMTMLPFQYRKYWMLRRAEVPAGQP